MIKYRKGKLIIQDTTLIDKSKIKIENYYNIDLSSRSRKYKFLMIKHTYIYVLKEYFKYRNIVLSKYWNYDHSTIYYLAKKIEAFKYMYPEYQELIINITNIIKECL